METLIEELKTTHQKTLQETDTQLRLTLESLENGVEFVSAMSEDEEMMFQILNGWEESLHQEKRDSEIKKSQKDYHRVLSKVGKHLVSLSSNEIPFLSTKKLEKELMDQLIAEHLYRIGDFELADVFIKESGSKIPEGFRGLMVKMHQVLVQLDGRDITSALNWVQQIGQIEDKDGFSEERNKKNKNQNENQKEAERGRGIKKEKKEKQEKIEIEIEIEIEKEKEKEEEDENGNEKKENKQNNNTQQQQQQIIKRTHSFEFKLHKAFYLDLLSKKKLKEAINYSRQWFKQFGSTHLKEIKQLAGCLVYTNSFAQRRFPELFDGSIWLQLHEEFIENYCLVAGIPSHSPLEVLCQAGESSVPVLKKVSGLVSINTGDELPMEIPVDNKFKFHSSFICPVSKERSTPKNPPVLLKCGHVISKSSMKTLLEGGKTKLKCPYCPVTTNSRNDCIEIKF
ncbi:hypothetical protein M0813_29759 [Anaeramoeba flamelloides]|uniref:RING-Gid-type domain-containing protein n=1 Tax=Anaeramoeba flamelloides TaxID=1746091 RepID=A0ABQ8XLZ4_9EUKA|nr:hypothetical protein M0813_29759 [Anaeramoeba flamelloides]